MRKLREATKAIRASLLSLALQAFNSRGFDNVTVGEICAAAGISNGSFFHLFPAKECLAAELYLEALTNYHRVMLAALAGDPAAARAIDALIRAHLGWVVRQRPRARFLFEQSRAEWLERVRSQQGAENARFRDVIETWQARHIDAGELRPFPVRVFISQVIGPAQLLCRSWLSGRDRSPPGKYVAELVDCAVRATVR
jgi:AcrR family transcriptional regulator